MQPQLRFWVYFREEGDRVQRRVVALLESQVAVMRGESGASLEREIQAFASESEAIHHAAQVRLKLWDEGWILGPYGCFHRQERDFDAPEFEYALDVEHPWGITRNAEVQSLRYRELVEAISHQCRAEAEAMLDWGLDPNPPASSDRGPALDVAVQCEDLELVRMLLDRGARGEAAVCDAAEEGVEEILRLLLANGERPDALDEDCGGTPLMLGARAGRTSVVRILLEAGADVNRWFEGENALQIAYDARHSEIVELLLPGANEDVRASIDRPPVSNCPSCSELNDEERVSHPAWARNLLQVAGSFVRDGQLAEEGRAAEDTAAEIFGLSKQLPGFFRCELRCTACQRRFELVISEGGHAGYLAPAQEVER